jgi:hypothetical protein
LVAIFDKPTGAFTPFAYIGPPPVHRDWRAIHIELTGRLAKSVPAMAHESQSRFREVPGGASRHDNANSRHQPPTFPVGVAHGRGLRRLFDMTVVLPTRDRQVLNRLSTGLVRLGPFLVVGLIALLTLKQLAVNALGHDRHLVAAIVEVLALAYIASGLWLAAIRWFRFELPNVLVPVAGVQVFLIAWWSLVLLIGPGGTPLQRVVSFGFDAAFSLLLWFPIAVLTKRQDMRIVQIGLVAACAWLLLVGLLQYVIGPLRLPALLQGDTTVALSGTTLGTIRVNGLIGTSVDYGLIMLIAAAAFFASLLRHPTRGKAIGTASCLIGIVMSGSRAAEVSMVILALALPLAIGTSLPRRMRLLLPIGAAIPILLFLFVTKAYLTLGSFLGFQSSVYGHSDSVRFTAISSAVRDVMKHPLFGTGIGYQNAPLFGDSAAHKVITDGFWWAVMLEGGVLGLVLVLALFVILGRALWRLFLLTDSGWAVTGLLTLAVTGIAGFINSSLDNQSANLAIYLLLGICIAASNPAWSRGAYERAPDPNTFETG